MAAWLKIVTMALRIAQLICAVIIIAIASEYMAGLKDQDAGHLSRFIFTDVVAAISLFLAFIWLIPFSSNHMNWHLDYILVLLSGAAAGWLIYSSERDCGKAKLSDSQAVSKGLEEGASVCDKWRALYVSAIISGALWLLSAGVGFFWVKKHIRTAK
ncbi:hypothetical protein G6O67_005391 [Ophiocordyceps sinensis]|uniref:MARVEL domain-containing protein n=2 Tax=Ophiocordyceps sinensis TaxID=72228 RepID=A0A8H4V5V1_9HYPO|nr:integral membrane protein [Ophiocordyceps sinensis CO18]KAF4509088.1 hypothetical protein G6O67_005391 [Ophiocordyceps sinensis]